MKKLLTLAQKVLKNLYYVIGSFDYYNEILQMPFKVSFRYFGLLVVVLTLAFTVKEFTPIYSQLSVGLVETTKEVVKQFPQDLILEIKDGELSANTTETVTIGDLAIIDLDGEIKELEESSSQVLLNKNNILVREGETIQTYPIARLGNTKLTKDVMVELEPKLLNMAKVLPYVVFVLLFCTTYIFFFVTRAAYLVALSIILWGFALIFSESFNFWKLYQFAIHSMTIPVVLELIFEFFGLNNSLSLGLLFPLLNIVISLGGMLNTTKKNIAG